VGLLACSSPELQMDQVCTQAGAHPDFWGSLQFLGLTLRALGFWFSSLSHSFPWECLFTADTFSWPGSHL
jgi:hypothetical protein